MIGMGSASCTHSPMQPGAPSASGVPQAVAGSLRRFQPPLARGEAHPMSTPRKLGPGDHCLESRCPLQLWESRVLPSLPYPCRSHFSLEVKLNSSSGLLFYVAGKRGTFMALFVSNGRFVFLVDIGRRQLRLRSKDKYHDRRWHTVSRGSGLSRTSLSHVVPVSPPSPGGRAGVSLVQPCSGHCFLIAHGTPVVPREQRGQQKHSQGWLNLEVSLPWVQPWGSSQSRKPPALALTFGSCRSSSAETRAEPSWSLMGCEPRMLQWPLQGSLWPEHPCMWGGSRLEKLRLTYR